MLTQEMKQQIAELVSVGSVGVVLCDAVEVGIAYSEGRVSWEEIEAFLEEINAVARAVASQATKSELTTALLEIGTPFAEDGHTATELLKRYHLIPRNI